LRWHWIISGVVLALAIVACDGPLESGAGGPPESGDSRTFEGTLTEQPPDWPGQALGLRTDGQFVFLVDRRVRPKGPLQVGELNGLRPGDDVRVEGKYYPVSIWMRGVVHVERIERLRH
jgi:hypothetical protein